MSERPNPMKRANQVVRAQKLVAVLVSFELSDDRTTEAQVAEQMTCAQWDALAELAGITPPSSETIAMAVAMMRGRAECDRHFHDMTFGNMKAFVR